MEPKKFDVKLTNTIFFFNKDTKKLRGRIIIIVVVITIIIYK